MSSQFPLISVNGVLNATVSPLDRGFTYGDGVFETCLYRAGTLPLWKFHRQRLMDACNRLRIPADMAFIESCVVTIKQQVQASGVTEGIVKVVVTRGIGGRGYALPERVSPTVCVMFFDSVPEVSQHIKVRICQQRLSRNPVLGGLKHLNRLEQIMARAEWQDEYDEGLMLDDEENIIEATASNIFIVKDGQLLTPDLSYAGVAGIMRGVIIEHLAPRANIPVVIKNIPLAELQTADELFVCNSVRGIMAVSELDADVTVRYRRHEITHSLQHHLAVLLRGATSEAG